MKLRMVAYLLTFISPMAVLSNDWKEFFLIKIFCLQGPENHVRSLLDLLKAFSDSADTTLLCCCSDYMWPLIIKSCLLVCF
jgi:hypothetical protein